MKQCYYCNHAIPDDATVCPMCGMDVKNNLDHPTEEKQTYHLNNEKYSRKAEHRLSLRKGFKFISRYVSHLVGHIPHPHEFSQQQLPSAYGLITFILSALLSAGIVTRVVGALERSYQILSKISILPVLSFTYNGMEWFLKLSLYFFIYYLLYGLLSYLFKKGTVKETLAFGGWLAHYSTMNVLYFLLLMVAFLLTLISPIALGIPALLYIVIYQLSYVVGFLFTMDNSNLDRKYYQGSLATGLHFLILTAIGYALLKL